MREPYMKTSLKYNTKKKMVTEMRGDWTIVPLVTKSWNSSELREEGTAGVGSRTNEPC